METREGIKGFGPVAAGDARVLLLGSYPSPQSFAAGFYYGHPQNRFWPLLATLLERPLPQSIEEKTGLILENRLALWDALESCEITGAADHSIRNPVPNDMRALFAGAKIHAVFCNGAASHRLYTRFCQGQTGLPARRLPSTSPANAAFSLERLLTEWQVILPCLRD